MDENKNKSKPKHKLSHDTRNTIFAATRARIALCVHESRLFVHMELELGLLGSLRIVDETAPIKRPCKAPL